MSHAVDVCRRPMRFFPRLIGLVKTCRLRSASPDESKESLRCITVDTEELFAPAPMRTVLGRVSKCCPEGWTITIMKGKVLAYEGEKKLKDVELHLRGGVEVEPDEVEAATED